MIKNTTDNEVVTVTEIKMTSLAFCIVGISPLVPHAVSAKSKGTLLFPRPKKNAAERASTMKHEPYEEFLDAAYRFNDSENKPTRLYMPAGAFHGAMASVAIDMAGAKKSQIGRLTTVPGGKIPIFGIPQFWMTVVISSDKARTPDIRTLPILPQWACKITVQFVGSLIKQDSIANLLAAAGVIIGVGDGRPQKGKLSMGQFRICSDNDQEFVQIIKQSQAAQDKALADPVMFDDETAKLYEWFKHEKTQRAAQPISSPKKSKASVATPSVNGGQSHETRPD